MTEEKACTRIGEIIRFHRKKAGLTQLHLANLAGVGKTAVFDVEKGKLTVQYETLLKILNVLNIRIEFCSPLLGEFNRALEATSEKHEKG